jgi:hypothetical protein
VQSHLTSVASSSGRFAATAAPAAMVASVFIVISLSMGVRDRSRALFEKGREADASTAPQLN